MNEKELKEKIDHCNSEIRKNEEIIKDFRDRIALHSLCISGQKGIITKLQTEWGEAVVDVDLKSADS